VIYIINQKAFHRGSNLNDCLDGMHFIKYNYKASELIASPTYGNMIAVAGVKGLAIYNTKDKEWRKEFQMYGEAT
jgi:hypothetical protein